MAIRNNQCMNPEGWCCTCDMKILCYNLKEKHYCDECLNDEKGREEE